MLSNAVSRTSPRARPLQPTASFHDVLAPVAVSSLMKARHRQQTRAYRFGMWSSYLDPDFHRDARRRHRTIKYKYAETLNRRLKWDQDSTAEDSKDALRRIVGRYFVPAKACCGSRIVTSDLGKSPLRVENHSDTGVGRGRVDMPSNSDYWGDWKSQLNDVVNQWTKQASQGTKRATSEASSSMSRSIAKGKSKHQAAKSSPFEDGYVIDPIRNRKVLKKTYGSVGDESDRSVETFKSYRSQLTTFTPSKIAEARTPVHSNGPPPAEELNKYDQVNIDQYPTDTHERSAANLHDLWRPSADDTTQAPIMQSEEYALNHHPSEDAPETYDDLHNYEPYKHDEPELPVEDSTPGYKDLDMYKPYRYNEPDEPTTAPKPAYNDLHKYRPDSYDGNPVVEESTPQHVDLHKYKPYLYQEDTRRDESSPKYNDLDSYAPYTHEEGRTSTTVPKYEDLDKYESVVYDEYKDTSDPTPKYEDLDRYDPKDFAKPEAAEYGEPFHQYGDLENYKAYRYQEPDGKKALERDTITESLNEFEAKNENRAYLEESMDSHILASDAIDREASASIHLSRQLAHENGQSEEPKLTGNFIQDFPEEFTTAWTADASSSDAWLQPKTQVNGLEAAYEQVVQSQSKGQNAEREHFCDDLARSLDFSKLETALDRGSKLETALNRNQGTLSQSERKDAQADLYTTEPRGLETCYAEECGSETTWPMYVKMYGSLESNQEKKAAAEESKASAAAATASENALNGEPTVYKILAYDPTMQTISIAETTSVVPDQAAPLTPTEVLLRLSNPTKFFPQFAPLQAEGFEIVSGSGDVLVFRKVRAAAAAVETTTSPVNPIDMMGKPTALPNAAAFVSPTGFVNYDVPPVEEAQSTPFRSNIDVRREEAVFSGPKYSSKEGKKKSGVTKRILIGGTWVAGISYALGVVGEYFTTGGIDGKGPTGF